MIRDIRKREHRMSVECVYFDFPIMFVFLFYLILFSSLCIAKGQCLKAVCKNFVFQYVKVEDQ